MSVQVSFGGFSDPLQSAMTRAVSYCPLRIRITP